MGLSWVSDSTLIYTSELIICPTICFLVSLLLVYQCYFSYGLLERFLLCICKQEPLFGTTIRTLYVFQTSQCALGKLFASWNRNIRVQVSEHVFAPNEGHCVSYPSNIFRHARSFENWGILLGYSPVLAGI